MAMDAFEKLHRRILQAQNITICGIGQDLKDKIKQFRFRKQKNIAALILKIDMNKQEVVLDEDMEKFVENALKSGRTKCAKDNITKVKEILEKDARYMVLDFVQLDCTIEEIQENLPDSHPRYIILSYVKEHSDGRVSYPLCFIYYCPRGLKPEVAMLYAGSRNNLHCELGMTKDFELQSAEDLTVEWLEKKL